MVKKTTLKQYTVFLFPPDHDSGEWPWWARVETRGWKSAYRAAVSMCIKDAIQAEIYQKDEVPDRNEFELVTVIEGWNEFKLEV